MRILLLLLFLSGCMSTNTKIGNLFFYRDILKSKDTNPELIGELYFKNNKLIFVEARNEGPLKNELIKKKIKMLKFKFNEINEQGYLKMLVPGEPENSPDGKKVVSENHSFKAVYINDKDFWNNLDLEMFYGHDVRIESSKN